MIKISGVAISTPVMNAACSVAKSIEDIQALCSTNAGAVLIGSITVEPRSINPEPNLQVEELYSLNSFGMPNKGMEYYKANLPIMVQMIRESGKKAILSIAGFGTDDYRKLAQLGGEVDLLELNLGCPNVAHSGIVSFDLDMVADIVNTVKKVTKTPIMVKVSPYSDPQLLEKAARVFAEHQVAAVVTSNTFPNGVFNRGVKPAGYAGVSGKALMPIALGQVYQFRSFLPRTIAIIGVGGIESKSDVQAYIDSGADAVQVATLLVRNGHAAINGLIG